MGHFFNTHEKNIRQSRARLSPCRLLQGGKGKLILNHFPFFIVVVVYLHFSLYFEGLNYEALLFIPITCFMVKYAMQESREVMIQTTPDRCAIDKIIFSAKIRRKRRSFYMLMPASLNGTFLLASLLIKKENTFLTRWCFSAEINCMYLLWGLYAVTRPVIH
jgi:hypothetical protein